SALRSDDREGRAEAEGDHGGKRCRGGRIGDCASIENGRRDVPCFPSGRGGLVGLNGHFRWVASNVTMADLTAKLSQQLNRQVNDATGLTGKYDINMYWMVAPIMMNSSEP